LRRASPASELGFGELIVAGLDFGELTIAGLAAGERFRGRPGAECRRREQRDGEDRNCDANRHGFVTPS